MRHSATFLLITATLAFSGAAHSASSLEDRKEKIKAMEYKVSPAALQRKENSENALRLEGVPINKFLPVIETEQETQTRTKEEVAYRALSLLVVAVKAEGLEQDIVEKIIADYGLYDHFTPKEKEFIQDISPSEHDRIQFVWRYEAAWTLLWALGYVDKLEKPVGICDVPQAVRFMQERSVNKFITDADLRPISVILDQTDRIYRYHWAVVDARINEREAPAGLEPGVTLERHYALNWLIGYMDQEWDDISTDT